MYFQAICSLQTGQSVNCHIALKAMFYLLNATGLCSGYHSDNLCVKKQLSKQWSKCPRITNIY